MKLHGSSNDLFFLKITIPINMSDYDFEALEELVIASKLYNAKLLMTALSQVRKALEIKFLFNDCC